ncbi:hypothetical protein [Bdellovibrio sp. HCB209]|uniref:hypothetical protein n=1 Tax=Bdellovibrio sp. HCB209 TaxID=3394354 RepID=UPI0039B3EC5C
MSFPWDGVLPEANPVIVRDLDVVGVGSLRQRQLLNLSANREVLLQLHTSDIPNTVRAIYDEELARTIAWLKPSRVFMGESFGFNTEVLKTFVRVFPKSSELLGDMRTKICAEYLEAMEWSSWLLQDHWRYFSGFVRQKFPQNTELFELTQWEWIHAWLEVQPFEISSGSGKHLVVNPSLQTLPITKYQASLNKPLGIYAFVCDQDLVKIREKTLDIYEACLLDLLAEDRAYTSEQLLQMALLEEVKPQISPEQWKEKIEVLLVSSIILNSSF